MKKAYMKKIAALLLFVSCLIFPLFAASETRSLSGRDTVFIAKITPRTGAMVVPDVKTPFYLEAEYNLNSSAKGYLEVIVYLKPIKGSGTRKILAQLPRKTVSAGKQALILTTPAVNLPANSQGYKTITVVSLKNSQGKELAYSNSENFLFGKRQMLKGGKKNTTDYFQMLSIKPAQGSTIKVSQPYRFKFKILYGLASRTNGFLNLEFTEVSQLETGMCWQAICVPLAFGGGVMEVEVPVRLPAALAGKTMGIAVPYRVNPLEKAVQFASFKSYNLQK